MTVKHQVALLGCMCVAASAPTALCAQGIGFIPAAAWQAGNTDSAIASFRRANQIYQAEPLGFIYLANLFIARDEPDSALKQANAAKYHMDSLVYATRMDSAAKYFRLAVPAASDPKYANDRREAWLNVARVYHSEKRYDEAAAAYREFQIGR